MKREDVLKHWANQWRSLAAWGGQIPMSIAIKPDNGCGNLGLARSHSGKAWVKDTGELARNLKTILHELAHLAAPARVHHGMPWRVLYARGAAEALGCSADDFELDVTLHVLGDQVEDAVRAWLERTGQATVLNAIGVL